MFIIMCYKYHIRMHGKTAIVTTKVQLESSKVPYCWGWHCVSCFFPVKETTNYLGMINSATLPQVGIEVKCGSLHSEGLWEKAGLLFHYTCKCETWFDWHWVSQNVECVFVWSAKWTCDCWLTLGLHCHVMLILSSICMTLVLAYNANPGSTLALHTLTEHQD